MWLGKLSQCFNALIKEFFPNLQLEFSLSVACDGNFCVLTEQDIAIML